MEAIVLIASLLHPDLRCPTMEELVEVGLLKRCSVHPGHYLYALRGTSMEKFSAVMDRMNNLVLDA